MKWEKYNSKGNGNLIQNIGIAIGDSLASVTKGGSEIVRALGLSVKDCTQRRRGRRESYHSITRICVIGSYTYDIRRTERSTIKHYKRHSHMDFHFSNWTFSAIKIYAYVTFCDNADPTTNRK